MGKILSWARRLGFFALAAMGWMADGGFLRDGGFYAQAYSLKPAINPSPQRMDRLHAILIDGPGGLRFLVGIQAPFQLNGQKIGFFHQPAGSLHFGHCFSGRFDLFPHCGASPEDHLFFHELIFLPAIFPCLPIPRRQPLGVAGHTGPRFGWTVDRVHGPVWIGPDPWTRHSGSLGGDSF